MTALFRVCFLSLALCLSACATRDEARQEPGLAPETDSDIPPPDKPAIGLEKVQTRPDSTPTPPPTDPMGRPLDPTGR